MSKEQERRETNRSPIRVLVRCLPPGRPVRRNGHDVEGWEMWAHNIADDGVGLRWSRKWAQRSYVPDLREMDLRSNRSLAFQSPSAHLKKGQEVLLDGLIYTEKGSKPMRGRIQWVRPAKKGDIVDFGVHITSPNHRSFFKALEG